MFSKGSRNLRLLSLDRQKCDEGTGLQSSIVTLMQMISHQGVSFLEFSNNLTQRRPNLGGWIMKLRIDLDLSVVDEVDAKPKVYRIT